MRWLVVVGLAASALVSGSIAPSAQALSGEPRIRTPDPITHLAADGRRVAVATRGRDTRCDRIVVWNVRRLTTRGFEVDSGCGGGQSSGGEFVGELALANDRVAWLEVFQGNLQDLVLRVRRVAKTATTYEAAFAENGSGAAEEPDGDYVGNLAGDRGLLVYNAWEVCTAVPPGWEWDGPRCDEPGTGDDPAPVVSGEELRGIGFQGQPVLLRTGGDSSPVVAAERSRVATRQANVITVLDAGGDPVVSVPVPGVELAGAALDGPVLAVVRADLLELYDLAGGTLTQAIPVPADARLVGLESGLAAYLAGGSAHVVRVVDGRVLEIPGSGSGVVAAALEPLGLSYAFNVRRGAERGRVVHLPLAELEERLDAAEPARA